MKTLLVTGAAGFIGFHVSLRCLRSGMHVVGLDNLSDVLDTFADVDCLKAAVGFCPSTPIELGILRFVEWYRGYYQVC